MSSDEHYFTTEQVAEIKRLKADTSDAGREKYQTYVSDALTTLHSQGVQPEPGSDPTLPADGRPQPEKGAHPDAKAWKAVAMRDDPNKYKIVDAANINVADLFNSEATAKQYIAYHVWKQGQTPPPPPPPCQPTPCPAGQHFDMGLCKCVPDDTPPPPPPTGSSTTKDGVKVPVKIKGAWDYTVREDWRDGGARFNMKAAGVNLVMVGYFIGTGGSDEVSAKVLGGRHTDGAQEKFMGCMYDLGVKVSGGKARMRCECPHPTYTNTLSGPQVIMAANADSIVRNWKGYMVIVAQEGGKVRLKWFQDTGPNDTAPANNWKQIYEYLDDGKNLSGIDSKFFPIKNLDHTKGTAQNTWRIDATPGLKQKWCAIAELDTAAESTVAKSKPLRKTK